MADNNKRNINTTKAAHTTNPHAPGYKGQASQGSSGSYQRSSQNETRYQGQAPRRNVKAKKKNTARKVGIVILSIFLVLVIGLAGVYIWLQKAINNGAQGVLDSKIATAEAYKGDVLNVLVLGIDYEEGRDYGKGLGMTDMIMYLNFDVKNHEMNMLQIPRDLFVGADLPTGGTGKINSLYYHGDDKANPVANLANVIHDQLQLPIDRYVTIEMDSLRTMVDHFGGIEVEVPHRIAYGGSVIEQGTWTLTGAEVEFFVRNRKGEGYANSDLDRLVMQRNFYKGLFKRIRTSTPADIAKLMPYFMNEYFNTDIPLIDCMGLAVQMLNVPSENILLARLPVYGAAENYKTHSVVVGAQEETAELLNQYFRADGEVVPASELNLAPWAHTDGLHDADVQYMGERPVTDDAGSTSGTQSAPAQ